MKKIILFTILPLLFILSGCQISEEKADSFYKNALEYKKQSSENFDKREDALFFFLKASDHQKYQTAEVANGIYTNAAQLLAKKGKNIDYDSKSRYNKNIISGIELLLKVSEKENPAKKESDLVKEELTNISKSGKLVYKTIRDVLNTENKSLLEKVNNLAK